VQPTYKQPLQHGDSSQWAFNYKPLFNKAQTIMNATTDTLNKSMEATINSEKYQPTRNHGTRQANSYDTGVDGDKASRYNAIKQQIIEGKLNPSINQIRKKWNCHQDTAKKYLKQLHSEGYLSVNPANSHYELIKQQ